MHADIRSTRGEIARKRAELRVLKSGDVQVPLAVALARVDELMTVQASEATPWLEALLGELTLAGRSTPQRLVDSRDHRPVQAMLVALLPAVGEALRERVRTEYAANPGADVHPDELPLRIATLERELLALEHKDVALSTKHGEPPRPDTAAEALLGVGT